MIIVLVVIALIFEILTGGRIFVPGNITNLITQNAHVLILAIGMTLVILTGRVDLSVGSLFAFTGALSGIFIVNWGLPVWLAIPAVLAVGALVGAWNGYWIAYRNIPFFVVTLGGMLIFEGLTMTVLGGRTIVGFPDTFINLFAGFIPDRFGGAGFNLMAVAICVLATLIFFFMELRKRQVARRFEGEGQPMFLFIIKLVLVGLVINLFGYWLALARGMPHVLILLAALTLIYSFITSNTVAGRHIYATGGNPKAAELSGLKTKRVVFWVYVNMGMLAALAGMVFAARATAASPRADAGFELQAIAAAFIGGASPMGGVGKVTWAVIGAMMMGVLNNGMRIMNMSPGVQLVIIGLVLLLVVAFDVYIKTKVSKAAKGS